MKESIIVDMKYADYDLIDGTPGAERHHVLQGVDRKKADKIGLWVPLSPEHHRTGPFAAHNCIVTKRLLQIIGQLAYEEEMLSTKQADSKEEARNMFRKEFNKSFL